jgi:acyl-CoA thioesterase-1
VVNASISGDTTAGGRARLQPLLISHKPTHVIIELGGNDALRGLPLESTRRNLADMVTAAKAAGARVLLVGMRMPPNYGRKYGEDFIAVYETVAQQQKVPLVPFLLQGVADGPDADRLFQADKIHPLAAAHPRMLANVWPVLKPMLKS